MVKDANFFTVFGWMANRYGLKGVEREIYAIILGFSQAPEQWFTGSIQYLADFTDVSYRTAMDSVHSLIEKGLITREKAEYGNSYRYKATISARPEKPKATVTYTNPYREVSPVYESQPSDISDEEIRAFYERYRKE